MEIPREEAERLLHHYQCECVVLLVVQPDEGGNKHIRVKSANREDADQEALNAMAEAAWRAMIIKAKELL